MKILLISPNTLTVPYPVYPIGLDYVAGSVADRHQVRIADMNTMTRGELELLLTDFAPQLIGLSCRNIDNTEAGNPRFFIDEYRELVVWLRARSRATIVCGGCGFTIMPERIFPALGADYGIIGEGERFGLLVEALDQGQDPAAIPGVLSALPGLFASAKPEATVIPPPWEGERTRAFRPEVAQLDFYLHRGGMLNLQSKRGCAFNCIYCPYPRIEGKKHRLVAPAEVARTALELQQAGAKYFFITDSAFNSDIEHSLAVARAFTTAGLRIPWGGFFAPVTLPPDYFTVMAQAGLKHVEFGTESLSTAMLRSYRKPFSVDHVLAAHAQARQAGLHTAHYFLLGGPGECAATVCESLEQIEKLPRAALFFFVGIRIYPGTQLCDIARAEGKITPATDLLQPLYYESDNISREAIEALVTTRAAGRINWIVGSGGEKSAATVSRLYERGYSGPLWEYLAR
ncbi:MAG: B12-binding domain-containing radical SAM protein [Desulfobulbaceae bacterium A2]|nr:MAG: B12-binding domain-containing radical SAM protein [Desulfobulbaceae bacterium A2]